MVAELKEVLSKVEQLKETEQREIAYLLQQEMSWGSAFEKSQKQLEQLANEAIQEYKSGKTKQTDW